jgi:hypothetical protein
MICETNKKISAEVKEFIQNVSKLNEESITDYLVWKWRELDKKFIFINIETFTHDEESKTTGADFEIQLELWLVGTKYYVPLVFQAKKFIKPYDGYLRKLNYPDGTQTQLKTLLNYSKTGKQPFPFYLFYSLTDSETRAECGKNYRLDKASLFMVNAETVQGFANKTPGTAISRNEILAKGNPLHCLFCCPLNLSDYFKDYFDVELDSYNLVNRNNQLPEYVVMLLNNRIDEMSKTEISEIIGRSELQSIRVLAVYDLRESEEKM